MFLRLTFLAVLTMVLGGFAIAEEVAPNLDAIVIGVRVGTIADDQQDVLKKLNIKLPVKTGLVIVHVEPRGPAANALLRKYDVITHINKKLVRNLEEFKVAATALTKDKQCEIGGYRAVVGARGKTTWKKGSVKVMPVTYRELVMNAMRSVKDEVRGTTTFKHVDSAEFVNSGSDFYCYFISSAGLNPTLAFRIQYVAEDWLFIRKFTIKADDATFEIDVSRLGSVEQDNSGGKIWEWYSRVVEGKDREMLEAISKAERVILRCEGDKYQKDRDLTEEEIARFGAVLTAYRILNGSNPAVP